MADASQAPQQQQQPKIRSTCDTCQQAKVRCSRDKPTCRRCHNQGTKCVYSASRRSGRPRRVDRPAPSDAPTTAGSSLSGPSSSTSSSSRPRAPSSTDQPCFLPHHHQPHLPAHHMAQHASPRSDTDRASRESTTIDSSMALDHAAEEVHHHDSFMHPADMFDMGGDVFSLLHDHTGSDLPMHPAHHPSLSSTASEDHAYISDYDFHLLHTPSSMASLPVSQGVGSSWMDTPMTSNAMDLDAAFCEPSATTGAGGLITPVHSAQSLESVALQSSMQHGLSKVTHQNGKCSCYEAVLQRLSELDRNVPTTSAAKLDMVLQLEKTIRLQSCQILDCDQCADQRPRTILLVGVMIERIVDLLEQFSVVKAAKMDMSSPGMPSPKSIGSASQPHFMNQASLQLGSYEICGDEKLDFLKFLLSTRLQDLALTVGRLSSQMQSNRQHFMIKAGSTMMVDIERRLRVVMARFEQQ